MPGTTYGFSNSGRIDNILFKEWFLKHFYAMPDQVAVALVNERAQLSL